MAPGGATPGNLERSGTIAASRQSGEPERAPGGCYRHQRPAFPEAAITGWPRLAPTAGASASLRSPRPESGRMRRLEKPARGSERSSPGRTRAGKDRSVSRLKRRVGAPLKSPSREGALRLQEPRLGQGAVYKDEARPGREITSDLHRFRFQLRLLSRALLGNRLQGFAPSTNPLHAPPWPVGTCPILPWASDPLPRPSPSGLLRALRLGVASGE